MESEEELLHQVQVSLLRIDPDILLGWDVQKESVGLFLERSDILGLSMCEALSRFVQDRVESSRVPDSRPNPGWFLVHFQCQMFCLNDMSTCSGKLL